ncbi:MAG: glycosyltransferase [Spirochaetaceae bacterium]
MLTVFFAGLSAAMVAVHIVILAGAILSLLQERRMAKDSRRIDTHRISVIVPARNEEQMLPRLLESIEGQDEKGFEVVLVDDRSQDRTGELMERFSSRFSGSGKARIVRVKGNPPPGNPKQHALAAGAAAARGDILLMTDADCRIPPGWVRTFSSFFSNNKVGLAFGTVIPGVEGLERRSRLWDYYQGFDQVFRYQYTAAAAGLGMPSGGFGNNLAVRRQALSEAGGFEGLQFSLTEDAQLICQVRETGKWKILAVRDPRICVTPAPQPTLSGMVGQSTRWNAGGLFAPDISTRIGYGMVMLYLCASTLLLPLALFFPPAGLPAAASLISMGSAAVTAGILNKPGLWYWVLLIPNIVFSMFYYSLITVLTLLKVPVSWKGLRLPLKKTKKPGKS